MLLHLHWHVQREKIVVRVCRMRRRRREEELEGGTQIQKPAARPASEGPGGVCVCLLWAREAALTGALLNVS